MSELMHSIFFMGFCFHGKYICIDGDDNEIERYMYAAIPYFWSFNDRYGYKDWESQLEDFFSYFSLTTGEKLCPT